MTLLLTETEREETPSPTESNGAAPAAPRPPLGAWETTMEKVTRRVADGPITFEEFVHLPDDTDDKAKHIELIDGVITERMAAQLNHERLQVWLLLLMAGYARARDLGEVLGSRTAVRVSEFRGRLPDLLFVRAERIAEIAREEGMYGPPDLVIELASPNDFAPQLFALETDYRTLGVTEIVIVNQKYQTVRVVRRRTPLVDANSPVDAPIYDEQNLALEVNADALLTLETLPGFSVSLADLFADPRPKEATLLARLLADTPAT